MPPTPVTHGPAKLWLSSERIEPALVYCLQREINPTHTGCREVGDELDFSGAVLAVAFADAVIVAHEEDADAPRTELCEQVAQRRCIFRREVLLRITIRYADCPRDGRLIEHVSS